MSLSVGSLPTYLPTLCVCFFGGVQLILNRGSSKYMRVNSYRILYSQEGYQTLVEIESLEASNLFFNSSLKSGYEDNKTLHTSEILWINVAKNMGIF